MELFLSIVCVIILMVVCLAPFTIFLMVDAIIQRIQYKKLHKASLKNRKQVRESALCGCFSCMKVFNSDYVWEYVDNGETALCPRCGIDAVLPGVTDVQLLTKMNHYWFDSEYSINLKCRQM